MPSSLTPTVTPNSIPPPTLQPDFSLRTLNTFGIDAMAERYLALHSVTDLQWLHAALQADPVLARLPRLILGGGSNLVLTGDFHGLVLHSCSRGIAVIGQDDQCTLVRAAAGVGWHELVNWTLARQLGGLENLSLIPGTVGAAPIQNIGAYGVEMERYFHALTAFDLERGCLFTLDRAGCRFGYRDSIFKHDWRDRAVIVDVTFTLPRQWQPELRYAELATVLAQTTDPTMQQVSAAVIAIRQRKLPDPAVIGNAGSFFKNPLVSRVQRDALLAQHPALVSHDQPDGSAKLAAGWLIDQCGWKGRALGPVGVYHKQALVLVNLGGARGADVLQLAHAIQADVLQRFGVPLEPEPTFV
ncbi:UDP-N-acetylmuramate dehydrogenase [Actimicrobium sp. CCI2.3]|uniref:UDP-N-acetylmuramate dehydrogenase n=1 Tax=Actimicrobium sp. CCI2.3 TaxID=3048616 RepID=UPI002AB49094|nr:UDP-N-acetylmuramate dehydrogenase [Actimicrobium sp. CCI2.3]MDY7575841.1 UDP-N-acetylmuramate dehydrogenase [Actimicrobium sp. CCI2.3]MEB0021654.1 UDP-N-acetylmuramate dehydrogenase [Actimicrobium sp. CCI2.3]